MKLAGIFFIAMVCVWTGMMASLRLSSRVDACAAFVHMLVDIKNEIGYLAAPTRQIAKKLAEDERYKLYHLFLKKWYTDDEPCASEMLLPAALCKTDKDLIRSFFKELGNSDINGQIALCSLCQARAEECFRQAQTRRFALSRLYLSLGVFSGIAAAILLL